MKQVKDSFDFSVGGSFFPEKGISTPENNGFT